MSQERKKNHKMSKNFFGKKVTQTGPYHIWGYCSYCSVQLIVREIACCSSRCDISL